MKILNNMHWMSIVGLLLILIGTALSFFGTYFNDTKSREELTQRIEEKNQTIEEIKYSNIKLIDQNESLVNSSN